MKYVKRSSRRTPADAVLGMTPVTPGDYGARALQELGGGHGPRREGARQRPDLLYFCHLDPRHYPPGRTRSPSRRPSPQLTMIASVPVRPATISTFWPQSWPTSTGWKWTVWSSRTTATGMPPAPRISAVAGSQRGGSARVMANFTLANRP